MNELIEQGYGDLKVAETREGHIEQSLLAKDNFQHYMNVADFLSKSSLVPKGMQNKPADVLIAMEMGLQIGIPMMQAIQDIAVINGKPSMYGDGLLAVVQGHKDFEWIKETSVDNAASCTIKRRNNEPHTCVFSVDDAKKAGLWGKQGPWSQYPERMLQMRARGFCIRDMFSDALRGIKIEEEVSDYPSDARPKQESASSAIKDLLSKSPRNVAPAQKKTIVMCSHDQQIAISDLIEEKNFSKERLKKAMEHFKVSGIYELSESQADEFISILSREP